MSSCSRTDIQALLKENGQHITASRIAICEYVLAPQKHSSLEEIRNHLIENQHTMSLSTIYNTLHMLVDIGKLKTFKIPGTETLLYDSSLHAHSHFYDTVTETIYDINPSEIDIQLHSDRFDVENINVVVEGRLRS